MAEILTITKEHDPGLYDSATGKTLRTEKVVDVTEDCPLATRTHRAVLLFTRAKRGRIVQVTHPYPGKTYMGAHTHFFVDEMRRPVAERDDTLASCAQMCGLSRASLIDLIEQHAPKSTVSAG